LEQMDDEDAEKKSYNDGENAKPSKFAYDEQQEKLRKAKVIQCQVYFGRSLGDDAVDASGNSRRNYNPHGHAA
jgi:hypothetical protein